MSSYFVSPDGQEIHPDETLLDKTIQPHVDGSVLFDMSAIDAYKEYMLSRGIKPDTVDTIAAHELEHARVASLFLPNVRLGVVQVPDRPLYMPFQIHWGAFIPRLVEASIAMAPPNISEQDVGVINALGYKSPEDVAERVDTWNALGRLGILIPRPKGRTSGIVKSTRY